jgi:putative acyl-CoA dehydrogenase
LPRLYRESPVNAIWEGSGNVMCLDVLRALKGEGGADLVDALVRDTGIAPLALEANENNARALVGHLAVLASAAALRAGASTTVADAYTETRAANRHGAIYGAAGLDDLTIGLLLQRALPET